MFIKPLHTGEPAAYLHLPCQTSVKSFGQITSHSVLSVDRSIAWIINHSRNIFEYPGNSDQASSTEIVNRRHLSGPKTFRSVYVVNCAKVCESPTFIHNTVCRVRGSKNPLTRAIVDVSYPVLVCVNYYWSLASP